jgi:hypothetical protein
VGLLEAAPARPRTSTFGCNAYPDLRTKAAAPLHSGEGPRTCGREQVIGAYSGDRIRGINDEPLHNELVMRGSRR